MQGANVPSAFKFWFAIKDTLLDCFLDAHGRHVCFGNAADFKDMQSYIIPNNSVESEDLVLLPSFPHDKAGVCVAQKKKSDCCQLSGFDKS